MSTESFYDLTPDVIIKAIEDAGFDPSGHCMALNSFENRVYDLRLENGSHIVAKFYRPGRWTREQILEEHEFLLELKGDEIPVCAPLEFPDGGTVRQAGGIFYAVWPRTGGRAADELSDTALETLGRTLARIHNMGAVKKAEHRIDLNANTYGREPLEFLLGQGFLPARCRKRYAAAVREIADLYDELSADVPVHRIHGDCHAGNLLYGPGGWHYLDFDDFLTGPAVQDVWMLVPARDPEGLRQRGIFLDAYRLFRDFNVSWLRLVEPLRSLRYIHYAAWLARRWDDPAFPAAFPHFGTAEYWERETADLEDQLAYMRNSDGMPASFASKKEAVEEKAELTNRDFFWDWEDK